MRKLLVLCVASTLAGAAGGCSDDSDGDTINVSGTAFAFAHGPYGLISGGTVSILEMPGVTTETDAEGLFEFEGLPAGEQATFVMDADGFPRGQTKTFTLPDADLERVTFQIPENDLFGFLAYYASIEVDPAACQMVSTVTVIGRSLFDSGAHGEAGALVTLDPEIPEEHGPIYFNESVLPDHNQTESSDDGGVLFANVPVGTYTMEAHADGMVFEAITMTCTAGTLVNASPPYGLQRLE